MGVIYAIRNKKTNQYYIGFASNFKRRKSQHFSSLRCNKHDNKTLQNNFNQYGENCFEIQVIESNVSYKDVFERENYWIHHYDSLVNGLNQTKSTGAGERLKQGRSKRGEEIRAIRKNANVTIKCIANILGIPGSSISKVELGYKARVIDIEAVEQLIFGTIKEVG